VAFASTGNQDEYQSDQQGEHDDCVKGAAHTHGTRARLGADSPQRRLVGCVALRLTCAFEMLVPILTRKRWSVPPHSRWPRPAAGAVGDEDRRYTRARILDLDRMAGVHTTLLG